MNVKIIPATAEDADALVLIQQQAFKRLYEFYYNEGNPYLRGTDEIISWLKRPNWSVYKIYADGALCGGVSFCDRNGMRGVYYLARLYILLKLQGNGIASTAILLCEKTVINANLWTLDFPVNEIMNRKCYEKAGYIDNGERWEQSGGAITLTYMEKKIPAFRDMKNHMANSAIKKLLSYCVFDSSPEGIANTIADYQNHNSWNFYGWVENGEILGVCRFEVHPDYVEILHISVAENARHRGIGGAMVTALQEKCGLRIEAETDADAVDFYRKCGFGAIELQKYNVRRWSVCCQRKRGKKPYD